MTFGLFAGGLVNVGFADKVTMQLFHKLPKPRHIEAASTMRVFKVEMACGVVHFGDV